MQAIIQFLLIRARTKCFVYLKPLTQIRWHIAVHRLQPGTHLRRQTAVDLFWGQTSMHPASIARLNSLLPSAASARRFSVGIWRAGGNEYVATLSHLTLLILAIAPSSLVTPAAAPVVEDLAIKHLT